MLAALPHGSCGLRRPSLAGTGGTVEENDIWGNEHAGVAVETGAAPLIRRNRIHDGKQAGAYFFEGGAGTFQENDVWGNMEAGVQIVEGASPHVVGNTLRQQGKPVSAVRPDKKQDGKGGNLPGGSRESSEVAPLWVHSGGRGTIQDNEITASLWHGVVIGHEGQPTLQQNRIHGNKRAGVHVMDGGAGTLLENDIHRNTVGVEVIDGSNPTVRGNQIHRHSMGGIWCSKAGRGTYEDNDVSLSRKANMRVWDFANPVVKGNRFHSGKTVGILCYEFGRGMYENNDIYDHADWNVEVKRHALPCALGRFDLPCPRSIASWDAVGRRLQPRHAAGPALLPSPPFPTPDCSPKTPSPPTSWQPL